MLLVFMAEQLFDDIEFKDDYGQRNTKGGNKKDPLSFGGDDFQLTQSNKNLQDKITSIRRFLEDFQKRLEGYEFVSNTESISYTGRVLCGSNTVQKLVSLLSPFAENSNLISAIKIEDYYREKYEINSTVNEMLLADPAVSIENYKTIMKMFKNTFKRIGNIINTSRDLMRSQFMYNEDYKRDDVQ
jgi:hypothetical protein